MRFRFSSFLGRAAALALLTAAAILPAAQTAHAQALAALNAVFERVKTDFKPYGLDNTQYAPNSYSASVYACYLEKGKPKFFSPVLSPGVEYIAIGAGDGKATKINIQVRDTSHDTRRGNETDPILTESSEGSDKPGVTFTLPKKQSVGIRLLLEEAQDGASSGWVALVVMQKENGWRKLPAASFGELALNLERTDDSVKSAHGMSADYAYDATSVYGTVLPPGGKFLINTQQNASKKYILIASSDNSAKTLTVFAGGNLKAATPKELGSGGGPKLIYKPTKAAGPGIGGVENTGSKPALVIFAAMQVINAS